MDDTTRQALSRERIDILAVMVQGLRAELAQAQAENARLRAACEAWDRGFVDGEEFDADQFLKWVNRNRATARAALEETTP